MVRTERLSARATSVATRMAKDSSRNVASCASLAFLASSISCWCRLLACSGGTVVRGKGQPEEGVMEGMRLRSLGRGLACSCLRLCCEKEGGDKVSKRTKMCLLSVYQRHGLCIYIACTQSGDKRRGGEEAWRHEGLVRRSSSS